MTSLCGSIDDLISSLGCYTQGMDKAHDGLMMLLWLGGTTYLVWLFNYCDVIYVHCDVTSIHYDVAFSMFITTMV